MPNKHEWRKREKHLYLPTTKPEVVDVPALKFLTISGEGNPSHPLFAEKVGALYALAYTIKMTAKKMSQPSAGNFDFTVYPLEGVWDINDEAQARYTGEVDKDDFVFDP